MTCFEVGDRIREARKRAKLNQEELAELARLNRVTVAKYESGKVEPGAQALARIADVLEVTVDELLGREAPEPGEQKAPRTSEARIFANWADNTTAEKRAKALQIIDTIFDLNADKFNEGDTTDDT